MKNKTLIVVGLFIFLACLASIFIVEVNNDRGLSVNISELDITEQNNYISFEVIDEKMM